MLHRVWLKVLVPLLAVAYAAYRVLLHVQISRARRAGDQARVDDLGPMVSGCTGGPSSCACWRSLFLALLVYSSGS